MPIVVFATAMATFAPLTVSEIGTSFTDVSTSIPVLLGLRLIIGDAEMVFRQHTAGLILAGLLFGAAAGLKMTNAVFAIGGMAAVAIGGYPLWRLPAFGPGGLSHAIRYLFFWAAGE